MAEGDTRGDWLPVSCSPPVEWERNHSLPSSWLACRDDGVYLSPFLGSVFLSSCMLRNVGEAMSGYLDPGCLSPCVPQALADVGLDLGEPDKDTLSESETATFSFSLSVWLTVTGLERPEPIFVGSLSFEVVAPADLLLTLESILLVLDLWPPRPGMPLALDLDGRGKLRYCREVLVLTCSPASS